MEVADDFEQRGIAIARSPGITGVWQVNGRSSVRNFAEVVNYDIEYRKNWSIWYDLKLIGQTFWVLFDQDNKAV
ncbi:MAG: sugar transferase [Pseudanabaena sp. ELA645]|jgi:lipopolysaccharide/colanic/teichoic acid biosynthesis glycosyltransferase